MLHPIDRWPLSNSWSLTSRLKQQSKSEVGGTLLQQRFFYTATLSGAVAAQAAAAGQLSGQGSLIGNNISGAASVNAPLGISIPLANNGSVIAFSDGFESGPGIGWTSTTVSGTVAAWNIYTAGQTSAPATTPHSGTYLADFDSFNAPNLEQARFANSADISIPTTSPVLTFWVFHDTGFNGSPDQVQAQLSTDGGTTWNNVGPSVLRADGTTGWSQVTVALTSYAGQTVRIGFLGTSGYGNDLYIDDIAITGTSTGINGKSILTGSIGSTVALAGSATGQAVNAGALLAAVQLSGSLSAGGGTVFSDGFEGAGLGWNTSQVSGTAGAWTFVTSGSHQIASPHSGSWMADFNSFTSTAGSQTRLYAASPFTIPATGTSTLSFWVYHGLAAPASADQVQVQFSFNNGITWNNVGSPVNRYDGTSNAWGQSSINLSGYSGQTVLLGFLGTSQFGSDLYLDDVLVLQLVTGPGSVVTGSLQAVAALQAAITGQAVGQGSLSAVQLMIGSIAGAGSAAGQLGALAAIQGSVASTTLVAGALRASVAMAGPVAGLAAVAGSLNALAALAGTGTAGRSTLSGSLLSMALMTAAVAGQASSSGMLKAAEALSGALVGQSILTGSVATPASVAGSLAAVAAIAGSLKTQSALTAVLAGKSTISGSLLQTALFAGSIAGSAILAGALVSKVSVTASVTGQATMNQPALAALAAVTGSVSGQAQIHSALGAALQLNGSVSGSSIVAGQLASAAGLSGALAGQGLAAAALEAALALAGTAAGASHVLGILGLLQPAGDAWLYIDDSMLFVDIDEAVLVADEADAVLELEAEPAVLELLAGLPDLC